MVPLEGKVKKRKKKKKKKKKKKEKSERREGKGLFSVDKSFGGS